MMRPTSDPVRTRAGTAVLPVLAAALLALLAFGVILVITAPFDGQARSSLGGSLISAGGIGGALLVVEVLLDRGQIAREQAASEALRVDLLDGAKAAMASFVRAHCEMLWSRLARNLDADLAFPPDGWQSEHDAVGVHRTLQWRIEIMARDEEWWRDSGSVAATDATYFVASDLADHLDFTVEQDELEYAQNLMTRTANRLSALAQRLSESGHVADATRLDSQADLLGNGDTQAYQPSLAVWRETEGVDILRQPDSGTAAIRDQIAWMNDRIRGDTLPINRFGDPVGDAIPTPEQHRWGALMTAETAADVTWGDRFTDSSWFRNIMATAAQELPELFGLGKKIAK